MSNKNSHDIVYVYNLGIAALELKIPLKCTFLFVYSGSACILEFI